MCCGISLARVAVFLYEKLSVIGKNMKAYYKGLAGEALALQYLLSKGFSHICSRYKTRYGEIDLIMQDNDTLVFVEVKYRTKAQVGEGLIAIDARKQERILLAAQEYIYKNNINSLVRIDVVEISKSGVYYIANAITQ